MYRRKVLMVGRIVKYYNRYSIPFAEDVQMVSPQSSPGSVALHGASRITGGVFRGRAKGNVFNIADADMLKTGDTLGPVKGKVVLYISGDDPATIKPAVAPPSMTFKLGVTSSLAELLEGLVKLYSPISCKVFPFLRSCDTNSIGQASKFHIFIHEDESWEARGKYAAALEDNEDVTWVINKSKYMLYILLVRLFSYFVSLSASIDCWIEHL